VIKRAAPEIGRQSLDGAIQRPMRRLRSCARRSSLAVPGRDHFCLQLARPLLGFSSLGVVQDRSPWALP
jgi:hypothetical protein